jgi:hypothetical protein
MNNAVSKSLSHTSYYHVRGDLSFKTVLCRILEATVVIVLLPLTSGEELNMFNSGLLAQRLESFTNGSDSVRGTDVAGTKRIVDIGSLLSNVEEHSDLVVYTRATTCHSSYTVVYVPGETLS